VHALAARAVFELPWWASRGLAVWAAAGISSWRAFSGQLAVCTVCSLVFLARRKLGVQEAIARHGGAQLVALRSRIVERLPSGRPRSWGSWKIAFFATVISSLCACARVPFVL